MMASIQSVIGGGGQPQIENPIIIQGLFTGAGNYERKSCEVKSFLDEVRKGGKMSIFDHILTVLHK